LIHSFRSKRRQINHQQFNLLTSLSNNQLSQCLYSNSICAESSAALMFFNASSHDGEQKLLGTAVPSRQLTAAVCLISDHTTHSTENRQIAYSSDALTDLEDSPT